MDTARDFSLLDGESDSLLIGEFGKAVHAITRATSGAHGEAFFQVLVKSLAQELQTKYAMISEVVDPHRRIVRTQAVWAEPENGENFEYSLDHTPCEKAMINGICIVPEGVQKSFPGNPLLVEMKVDSYAGVALTNHEGEQVGILCAMGVEPLKPDERLIRDLLIVIADRAIQEIEYVHHREILARTEAGYRDLTAIVPCGVFELDASGYVLSANKNAMRLTGYEADDLRRGMNFLDLFDTEHQALAMANIERAMRGERMNPTVYTIRRKDGVEMEIRVKSMPIIIDQVTVGLRGIFIPVEPGEDLFPT